MRYGNCMSYKDTKRVKILKYAGFDYIETGLAALYTATEAELADFLGALGENKIKCEAVNVLFPGDITLTGENADLQKTADYIAEVFEKTKEIGFKSVVFGSGGARKVPDGFPKEKATEQIMEMLGGYLAPAAEKYDFTVAIEELNRSETNIINTIEEAEYIINQVNHPRIKLLADLYHIAMENGDADLSGKGNILEHCHIANPYNGRKYPQASDEAKALKLYKIFFGGLKNAGYYDNGKLSIEGGLGGLGASAEKSMKSMEIPDWVDEDDRIFYAESKKSLEFMKTL